MSDLLPPEITSLILTRVCDVAHRTHVCRQVCVRWRECMPAPRARDVLESVGACADVACAWWYIAAAAHPGLALKRIAYGAIDACNLPMLRWAVYTWNCVPRLRVRVSLPNVPARVPFAHWRFEHRALSRAVKCGHIEIAAWILQQNDNFDGSARMCMAIAATHGCVAMFRWLHEMSFTVSPYELRDAGRDILTCAVSLDISVPSFATMRTVDWHVTKWYINCGGTDVTSALAHVTDCDDVESVQWLYRHHTVDACAVVARALVAGSTRTLAYAMTLLSAAELRMTFEQALLAGRIVARAADAVVCKLGYMGHPAFALQLLCVGVSLRYWLSRSMPVHIDEMYKECACSDRRYAINTLHQVRPLAPPLARDLYTIAAAHDSCRIAVWLRRHVCMPDSRAFTVAAECVIGADTDGRGGNGRTGTGKRMLEWLACRWAPCERDVLERLLATGRMRAWTRRHREYVDANLVTFDWVSDEMT